MSSSLQAIVCSPPTPLSTEFSRQEYWSGLLFLLRQWEKERFKALLKSDWVAARIWCDLGQIQKILRSRLTAPFTSGDSAKWKKGESVSPSVVCDFLQPHGISTEFSRQEYWSGLQFQLRTQLSGDQLRTLPWYYLLIAINTFIGFYYINYSNRWASQVAQPDNAEDATDTGSVPGSGRSPGWGNGNPLQYACLENSVDRGSWQGTCCGVSKNHTEHSTHNNRVKMENVEVQANRIMFCWQWKDCVRNTSEQEFHEPVPEH